MPRKKKDVPPSLEIKFTGKMSILVELEGHGPIQWQIDDLDIVQKVAHVILDATNHNTPVAAYNARQQKTFTNILDSI